MKAMPGRQCMRAAVRCRAGIGVASQRGLGGRSIHYMSACTYGVVLLEMMCSDPCTDWFARLGDLFYQLFHFAMCRTLSRLDAA